LCFHLVRDSDLDNSFEKGFGSWTHSNLSTTRWTLHNASTPTPDTGPINDHTYGNSTGKYIFFESSYPMRKGDNALLLSPKILVPDICLKVSY